MRTLWTQRVRGIPSLLALLAIVLTSSTSHAQAVDSFLSGLDALAAGKYDQAVTALAKAAEGKPDSATFQLDHGVALLMAGRANDARDALTRAEKLDPQNQEILLWSQARSILFDPPKPPTTSPDLHPPGIDLPYGMKVYVASYGVRSPNASERARARTALEEVAREFATSHRNGIEAVKALYQAQRYRDALTLIDAMLAKNPLDSVALAYAGHCKLGLRDYAGARETYTRSLSIVSTHPGCLVGRARCEITLGALDAAEADLTLARRINSKPVAATLAEADQLLSKAKASPQKSPGLTVRAEQFTRELCRLELNIADHPKDAAYLVALSRFFLQPTEVCDITVNGVSMRGRVPCAKKDETRSTIALNRAKELAPDDPQVSVQDARLALARGHLEFVVRLANPALDKGISDLEMSVGYMQYARTNAGDMNAEAARIRNKIEWRPAQQRPNGTWEAAHYEGPSAAEWARADELDAKAKELRANATYAFKVLQKQTANATDPQSKLSNRMADAYQLLYATDRDGATRAAEEALAIDPLNDHVLRFLRDAYGRSDTPKARQVRATLEEINRF